MRKYKQAVALRYDAQKELAPRVVAAGKNIIAEKILAIAKEYGIPIQRDPDLVEVLGALDVGDIIPEELYQAVAEVLTFIYRTKQRSMLSGGQ